MHIELLGYNATQPNTGAAATAMAGGSPPDSLILKNNIGGPVIVRAWWGFNQVEGWHQVIVPSAHDTTRNQRAVVEAADQTQLWPAIGMDWEMFAQETLQLTIAGSNTSGDVECGFFLLEYSNVPGMTQRLITHEQLLKRGLKPVTIQCSIAGSGAGYSGAELINADSNLLKANHDYALLGIMTETPVGAVTFQGPDTGNVKIGVPGTVVHKPLANEWFVMLARAYNRAMIPVFSSGNSNSTYFGVATNENATTTIVSAQLIDLGPTGG